jgi:acylphosphatase
MEYFRRGVAALNPGLVTFPLSCRTGEGLEAWLRGNRLRARAYDDQAGVRIHITGIVQGVGFRPFVYSLARRYGLTGWVRNTSAGVDIEADGTTDALAAFTAALRDELPPLARIDSLSAAPRPESDGLVIK